MASVHSRRSDSTASLSMSRSLSHSRHSTTEPTTHSKTGSDLFSPLLSLSFNSTVTKTVRAYEVDRQRTKNKREYELAQERKEQAALEKEKAKNGGGRRNAKDIWEQGQNAAARGSGTKAPSNPAKVISRDVPEEGIAQPKRQVTLDDLIKPGGHGGSRRKGRKGKDGDFEVIPHIRAVIALDDEPDMLELDEPWEHVNADDDDERRGPSYAAIVARVS